MINIYIQGNSKQQDRHMFGMLGEYLTQIKLHEHLGMAITSEHGDIWFIDESNGDFKGFALIRKLKSKKSIHLRFLFSKENKEDCLINSVIEWCNGNEIKEIHTNDRITNWPLWRKHGFSIHATNKKGSFVRFEIDLERIRK